MPIVEQKCGCGGAPATDETRHGAIVPRNPARRYVVRLGIALIAWWLLYDRLLAIAQWATYGLLGLEQGSHLAGAVEFFLFDTPKVLLLLTVVVFGVGVVRSFFTPERTRRILAD